MTSYSNTLIALSDVKALFKCDLCLKPSDHLYVVAKCANSFCLSCAEENRGLGCPVCKKIGDRKEFGIYRLYSLLADTVSHIEHVIGISKNADVAQQCFAHAEHEAAKLTTESQSVSNAELVARKDGGKTPKFPRVVRQIKRRKVKKRVIRRAKKSQAVLKQALEETSASKTQPLLAPLINKSEMKRRRDAKGNSPLQNACLATKEDLVLIMKLLQSGSNPNERDNIGWTPLHEAALRGRTGTVELLIKHGAIVDAPGGEDYITPLHDALLYGELEVAKILLHYGADPQAHDIKGRRPIDIAREVDKQNELRLHESSLANPLMISPNFFIPKRDRLVLCFSSLSKERYERLVPKLREIVEVRVTVVDDVDEKTTHFITPQIVCRRTMKFFIAVALGKWIVSGDWLEKSLLDGQLANEAEFEVKGTPKQPESQGPKLSRENNLWLKPPLFTGISVFCRDLMPCLQYDFKRLLKYAGAKVVFREAKHDDDILTDYQSFMFHGDLLDQSNRFNFLIVYDSRVVANPSVVNTSRIRTVSINWILDCLEAFKILPLT